MSYWALMDSLDFWSINLVFIISFFLLIFHLHSAPNRRAKNDLLANTNFSVCFPNTEVKLFRKYMPHILTVQHSKSEQHTSRRIDSSLHLKSIMPRHIDAKIYDFMLCGYACNSMLHMCRSQSLRAPWGQGAIMEYWCHRKVGEERVIIRFCSHCLCHAQIPAVSNERAHQ